MIQNFIRDFPGVIRIEPSSLCNLKCIHCPTRTIKMHRGVMDSSTFDLVIQNIRDTISDIRVVVLYHGGEPLLNKQFPSMVRRIKELGVPFVKTVSNGMLLNDKISEEICESGLDAIEFSLDGISFEQNDLIRRGCKGKSVVGKIKQLVNYKKIYSFQKPEIYISTTQFLKINGNDLTNPQSIPGYLMKAFSNEFRYSDLKFKTTVAMRWPDMNVNEKQFSVLCDNEGSQTQNYCDHVMNTITVRWNGDIVPCCYDLTSKVVLGNIHDNNLRNIWNNEEYLRLRMSIHNKKFYPLCNECNTVRPHQYLLIRDNPTDL